MHAPSLSIIEFLLVGLWSLFVIMFVFAIYFAIACVHREIVNSTSADDVLVLSTHVHSEFNMLPGTCGCSVYFCKING